VGTRNLIEVKLNNEIKVAQYGQWDGYFDGQGIGIARFINEHLELAKFKEAVSNCTFYTDEQLQSLGDKFEREKTNWTKEFPWLSRDTGADVLKYIQDENGLKLKDEGEFKKDTLFCEYHYLIDLDNQTVTCGDVSLPFTEWTEAKMKELQEAESE
jgi:hypothetical protein